tara:strand:- start:4852 stop:5076 length:225 start_codon:yes stop_codon:yes gene_type:complete
MIEIKTKLRKWGNSFGVVLPINKLKKEKIHEGEEVIVLLTKRKINPLRETFGTYKFKKSTQEIMDEIDRELYDD